MLFTARSIWTMVHGMVLGGGALLALAAVLYALWVLRPSPEAEIPDRYAGSVATLTVLIAVALWITVLAGTYIVFPPYRATPPEGLVDLAYYPRSLLLGNPETAWLHAFAMETKEHVPFIAAMLSTAAAFVSVRYRSGLLGHPQIRGAVMTLTAISFALVAYVAVLGVFVNKVAPLE
jgi:hypothetical protein